MEELPEGFVAGPVSSAKPFEGVESGRGGELDGAKDMI